MAPNYRYAYMFWLKWIPMLHLWYLAWVSRIVFVRFFRYGGILHGTELWVCLQALAVVDSDAASMVPSVGISHRLRPLLRDWGICMAPN